MLDWHTLFNTTHHILMKRPYLGLWALLAVAFIAFAALSFNSEVANDLGLKTGTFEQTLTAQTVKNKKKATTKLKTDLTKRNKQRTGVMDTTKKTILFIGDSMLEGLGPRLAAYAKENGHTLYYVIWYSSTSEVWGRTTKLKEYIKQFKPNYVFICLGSNELFVRDIQTSRQKYVDNIIAQIGNLPYVWIGPPNWKPDTGINEMIKNTAEDGCYYNSYTPDQHYDRSRDGAHPTRASAAAWMDRVAKWVMTKSAYPIRLNKPKAAKAKADKVIILQPAK